MGHFSFLSSVLPGGAQRGPSRVLSFPRLERLRAAELEADVLEIRKRAALNYAWSFIGQPYRWGGDDPIHGFDCSGLAIEVLTAAGILPHRWDGTASQLLATLMAIGAKKIDTVQAGALVFFRNTAGDIIHVELGLPGLMLLGASGGGSATDDLEDAAQQNAFVKIRPAGYRSEAMTIVDPFASQARKESHMPLMTKAKAIAGDIVAIIAAALGLIPGLFKKKPYVLWQWDPTRKIWLDHGTYSARQCKKLRAELIRLGQAPETFTILRKGAKPPAEGPK